MNFNLQFNVNKKKEKERKMKTGVHLSIDIGNVLLKLLLFDIYKWDTR